MGVSFCFFESSSLSFINVLQFSAYRSFTSLVRFTAKYFIFLMQLKGIFFFPHSLSDSSLLSVKKCNRFLNIHLVPCYLAEFMYQSSSFCVESLGFSIYSIMSSAYNDNLERCFLISPAIEGPASFKNLPGWLKWSGACLPSQHIQGSSLVS